MFGISVTAVVAVVAIVAIVWAARAGGRPTAHSVARVHVDDLATGRLPSVCIRTGDPSELLVEVESGNGRFQAWWLLLLLLGPIGIIAIVLLYAFAPRHNHVGGVLPITRDALDAHNRAIRAWRGAMLAFGVLAALGLLGSMLLSRSAGYGRLAAVAAIVAVGALVLVLLVSIVGGATTAGRWVALRPDASGTWVAIDRVHPGS